MNTSEKIDELTAALVKAQAAMPALTKDRIAKVPHKSGGGSHSYSYIDLASVIEAVKGPLSDNGLSVTQVPVMDTEGFRLVSRLMHISGQWIEASYPLNPAVSSQEMGSAMSYGRRYTLCGLLGIAAEDDDGASVRTPARAPERQPRPGQEQGRSGVLLKPQDSPKSMALGARLEHAMTTLNMTRDQLSTDIQASHEGRRWGEITDAEKEAYVASLERTAAPPESAEDTDEEAF